MGLSTAERSRRYRARHSQEIRSRDRARYRADPRYGPAKQKRWRSDDPERSRQVVRQYKAHNPEQNVVSLSRKRARKAGAEGKFTRQEWAALKAHYNFTCLGCGRVEPDVRLTVDHVIPTRLGGPETIDNVQPLCGPCNTRKGQASTDYRPNAEAA